MRKLTYLAVFEPSSEGGYGVYFPDVSGCMSYGNTLTEAQKNAEEALGLHIYGLEQDGDIIPEATDALPSEDEIKGCIVVAISIFPDMVKIEMDNKRVKTNITLPLWLKHLAEEKNVNFSRVLETALIEYLGISGKVYKR